VIEFDNKSLDAKAKAIIDRVMVAATETEVGLYFGAVTRWGRVECEPHRNRSGSRDFVLKVLQRVSGAPGLSDRFVDMVGKVLKRSKKLQKALAEIDQKATERWCCSDYTLSNRVDGVVQAFAVEHAKRDFLAILQQVGDDLQKEVDTKGPAV